MSDPPLNMLLVDDERVDVRAVQRALRKAQVPHRLTIAGNGLEALDALAALRDDELGAPPLVLLDLNMPRMGGLAFLDALRDDPNLERTVVFVHSTSSAQHDVEGAYARHVAGYFVKSDGDGLRVMLEMLQRYCRLVEFPHAH